MTTTDSNGLIRFQTSDPVAPLQTQLNLITASVSTYLGTTVQTRKAATATDRTNLATENPPSASKPLLVWQQNTKEFWLNSGDGWAKWPPEPVIPAQKVVHYAGKADHKAIAKKKVLQVTVKFGSKVNIGSVNNWIPQVTLRNGRANLPFTISNYTKTGFKMNIYNAYNSTTSAGTIYWALLLITK